ncbi:MAG: hypothetical protein ACRCZO_06445 [Cetobacterium sp.]
MKISTKADYAIRITLYLFGKEDLTSEIEIVRSCQVPEKMEVSFFQKKI